MALFAPSESPAVIIKEIDLTGGVPNVQTTTGVFVGDFNWGPVDKPTLVDNEATLVSKFTTPDTTNNIDFHVANSFLTYSSSLYVIRAVDSNAVNSYDTGAGTSAPTIRERDHFDTQFAALDSDGHTFIAKYPGTLGNNISVQMCPYDSADAIFDAWTYASSFDAAPTTSTLVLDE